MYFEERKGNLLKQFLIKLILVIIFVLLLIWLVPWPNMDNYINALNPLKDQIFNTNIQTMKEAAITYYTTERLPENVGDVKKLTLQEMLDLKLLIPFTDRNGNSCDVTKSYVTLEKKDTEYLMKVNLKCGEEEHYILVHLGCYSYCSTDICEAKPGYTEKPSVKPVTPQKTQKPVVTPTYKCTYVNGKYYDNVGNETNKTGFDKACAVPTVTPKPNPKCAIVNGIYYDNKGNVVNQEAYQNACVPKPVYKCALVNGVYYDANGNKTDEAGYKKACVKEDKHICVVYNGNYYDKNGNITNEVTYKEQCLPHVCEQFNGKYYGKDGKVTDVTNYTKQCVAATCKVVNGVYFDKNGNITNENTYQEQCFKHVCTQFNGKWYDNNGNVTTEAGYKKACVKSYQYEYKKSTPGTDAYCAAWSNWSVKELTAGQTIPAGTITYIVEDLGTKKVQTNTLPAVYESVTLTTETMKVISSKTIKVCTNYKYEIIGNDTYQVNGDWAYTGEEYRGYSAPQSPTATTRWIAVGVDFNVCGNTCTNHPYVIWKKQTRSATKQTGEVSITATCTAIENRTINVYAPQYVTTTTKALKTPEQPLYENRRYYREKTCINYIAATPATTNYVWSASNNDTNLLNQGYVLTGRIKEV